MRLISSKEHALMTAKFHSSGEYGWNGLKTDLEWCKRWIDRLEKTGALTKEDADEIRREAGWSTQMRLL